MTFLRVRVAALLIAFFAVGIKPVAAVVTYGTPGAAAALTFDPYHPAVSSSSMNRSSLLAVSGVAGPTACVVPTPRTPVNPGTPILDVVDAPTVFEAPYLHGGSGLKASFVVTLRNPPKTTVTVKYRTFNGTARDGIEYKGQTGTLTFLPGRFSQVVLIDILRDDLKVVTNVPFPRTFFLEIFSPTNATIGRDRGVAAITENGSNREGVTVTNALPVYEVGVGLKSVFMVVLNRPSVNVVKVDYATQNGTAFAGSDYAAASGTLTFQPGQTVKTVSVRVFDNTDNAEKIVETFFLEISNPVNAILLRHRGTAEILEFSNGTGGVTCTPQVSISPVTQSVLEGNSGTKPVNFTVKLNHASTSVVKVGFSTANDGASKTSDYIANSGVLTFSVGETTKTVTVLVRGDTLKEGDENFRVDLLSPVNATLGVSSGTVTIKNDD